MIAIHPVHRRLAELHLIATKRSWTQAEIVEVHQCMMANAALVIRLDELKQLAFAAQIGGDMDWVQEICRQIDELEAKMI